MDTRIRLYRRTRSALHSSAATTSRPVSPVCWAGPVSATGPYDPRIAEVGAPLDAKVAELLRLMTWPVPPELITA